MFGICILAIFFNKARLEDFRIMCIDDVITGLFEVANKKLKHPHLHFEPRLFFVLFHHLEKSRGNLGNFSSPWQNADKARFRPDWSYMIYECRCDERLKTKAEGSTRLVYTGLVRGLDHLKL
jgi:hypothetical protein